MSVSTYNQIARRSGNNSAVTSASACSADHTESNASTWLAASEIVLCRTAPYILDVTADRISAQSRRPPIKNKSVKREIFEVKKKKKSQLHEKAAALLAIAKQRGNYTK